MTEKPRETQAESHVVEFKEKVNNSSLMKHPSFPDAIVTLSSDGEGVANLWDRIRLTYAWRWEQLEIGRIEVVTDLTEPDEWSSPPEAGLRPVTGGDQYDDYVNLTGWEDSR